VMPAVAWLVILAVLGVSVCFRGRVSATGKQPLRPSLPAGLVVGALIVQTVGVLTRPAGEMPSFRISWLLAFAAAALTSAIAAAPTEGTIRVPAATAYIAPDPGSVRFPRSGEVAPFARDPRTGAPYVAGARDGVLAVRPR